MRHTVTLGWPAELLNLNDRHHHHKRAKLTAAWRQHAHARFADLAAEHGPLGRVRIVVYYRFADNRRRDVGNLQLTTKAICDGITDSQLIVDDSDAYLVGPDNRRERPNGTPRVSVIVYELTEADDAA